MLITIKKTDPAESVKKILTASRVLVYIIMPAYVLKMKKLVALTRIIIGITYLRFRISLYGIRKLNRSKLESITENKTIPRSPAKMIQRGIFCFVINIPI